MEVYYFGEQHPLSPTESLQHQARKTPPSQGKSRHDGRSGLRVNIVWAPYLNWGDTPAGANPGAPRLPASLLSACVSSSGLVSPAPSSPYCCGGRPLPASDADEERACLAAAGGPPLPPLTLPYPPRGAGGGGGLLEYKLAVGIGLTAVGWGGGALVVSITGVGVGVRRCHRATGTEQIKQKATRRRAQRSNTEVSGLENSSETVFEGSFQHFTCCLHNRSSAELLSSGFGKSRTLDVIMTWHNM